MTTFMIIIDLLKKKVLTQKPKQNSCKNIIFLYTY